MPSSSPRSQEDRAFHVVVYGATGFTGQLVVEYFARVLSHRIPSLRWAIAGRNHDKLVKLLARVEHLLPADANFVGVFVASSLDPSSLDRVAACTRTILSTAGPFLKLGLPVVDACVRQGCHYTDITGETPFVRQLIDKHHEAAKTRRISIVPMCGFDSIPSDLGAFFVAKELSKQSAVRSVIGYFISNGGPSGGTLNSGQNMMSSPSLREKFDDPFLLGGHHVGNNRSEDADIKKHSFSNQLGMWNAPFGMAQINTRVVRRSTALFGSEKASLKLYSPKFSYNEVALAPSEKVAKKLANPPPPAVIKKMIAAGRLPKPGQGPSKKQRDKTFFGVMLVGKAENGAELLATVQGGDPGYDETAKMVSETAICLAFDKREANEPRYGVVTPSFAFGSALVEALAAAGLVFRVEKRSAPTPEDAMKAFQSFVRRPRSRL